MTHGAPKLLHEEVGFTGERIAERIESAVAEHSGVRRLESGPSAGVHQAVDLRPQRLGSGP